MRRCDKVFWRRSKNCETHCIDFCLGWNQHRGSSAAKVQLGRDSVGEINDDDNNNTNNNVTWYNKYWISSCRGSTVFVVSCPFLITTRQNLLGTKMHKRNPERLVALGINGNNDSEGEKHFLITRDNLSEFIYFSGKHLTITISLQWIILLAQEASCLRGDAKWSWLMRICHHMSSASRLSRKWAQQVSCSF